MNDEIDRPDYLAENADGSVTISLRAGVSIDGARVRALTMREPTVDDQLTAEKVKGSPAEREVTLFANLCEVAPGDIRGMSMRDYGRLQEAYRGFLD